jgi:tetratricopeptide (TPR) repeat protein
VIKEDFPSAIRNRNAARICYLLLGTGNPPRLARGAGTESELWDYKADVPSDEVGWARIAKHVLAFHNKRGGALIFGIRDGDLQFTGATRSVDSKSFNDKIRKYVGDQIWVDFHREWIQKDQRYLGLAIIPPRGPMLAHFRADAPSKNDRRDFKKGESAIREGDSSIVLSHDAAVTRHASVASGPIAGTPYTIDVPFFRVLALETHEFIRRDELANQIARALRDPRTSVTSLIGIGGSGKTTLATWAVHRAYEKKAFDFIVSLTAKDRELGTLGIQSLTSTTTSFEVLLDTVLDVLGFQEVQEAPIEEREREVRDLLKDSSGLLYVDNLETVDDPRVISFLDDLPVGVRAIVTSRRATVRVAVRPIDIGPLSVKEARALVASLGHEPGTGYVADLSEAEMDRVAEACDRLPLAIRWILTRGGNATEALHRAEGLRAARGADAGQLLEFVFRRVFDGMTPVERAVMQTLSIFSDGSPMETLVAGTGHDAHAIVDALADLARDALAQRLFDAARNDYIYALAPLTRSFVLAELRRDNKAEQRIRQRLSNWYEAIDVKRPEDRAVARELRQGRGSSEDALVDLAQSAEKNGDYKSAQEMYEQALSRNPKGWLAARRLAEFERHINNNRTRAMELYERAAANAPARGADRALIFREWGMLLRDSGMPDAISQAIEKFELARQETPNDPKLLHALAALYDRRGVYRKVIELLEPLGSHPSPKTRAMSLRLLVRAYDETGAMLEAAEARRDLSDFKSTAPSRLKT